MCIMWEFGRTQCIASTPFLRQIKILRVRFVSPTHVKTRNVAGVLNYTDLVIKGIIILLHFKTPFYDKGLNLR